MSISRVRFGFDRLTFTAAGDPAWVAEQFDKVLAAAPDLLTTATPMDADQPDDGTEHDEQGAEPGFSQSLASHIKAKGAEDNQVQRFLTTADWLRRRGKAHLTTAAVSKALKDNHQKKLSNPSDCLGKLINKGYCERGDGGTFYIAPDGLKVMGGDA